MLFRKFLSRLLFGALTNVFGAHHYFWAFQRLYNGCDLCAARFISVRHDVFYIPGVDFPKNSPESRISVRMAWTTQLFPKHSLRAYVNIFYEICGPVNSATATFWTSRTDMTFSGIITNVVMNSAFSASFHISTPAFHSFANLAIEHVPRNIWNVVTNYFIKIPNSYKMYS